MFANKIDSITHTVRLVIKKANYVTKVPKPVIPKNSLASVYSANNQQENGTVYDRKPFKVTLEEGKTYHWCLCGRSKSQPLCDGTHKDVYLKINQRPIRFKVEKTKDYWLCNCKQTKNRPFVMEHISRRKFKKQLQLKFSKVLRLVRNQNKCF